MFKLRALMQKLFYKTKQGYINLLDETRLLILPARIETYPHSPIVQLAGDHIPERRTSGRRSQKKAEYLNLE